MSQKKSASPYYLYCQADIHLQWAFAKSQHGDYLSAALDFRAAYQLLQKNTILYPNFIYNNKDLGILNVILGTIPDGYKWIANIAGLSGNFEEGMSLMKNFIAQSANNQLLPVENQSARLLYCLLLINFDKDKLSNWSLTDKFTNDYQTNLMTNCVRAFVASKCDMADEGIKNLLDKPHTKDYVSFYYTDYLLGSMKLNRLDEDASMYLKRFVSLCPNKSLYQETYTKLAWSYIVKGDTNNYYLYAGLSNKYSENEKKWLIISSQGDENKLPNIS
ncbi:MAG: hypothetical protein NTU43_00050, partial [Bacteroidetes bacterium]|nr:hypothetical protein [Bacteroidota bacterium]